MPKAYDLIAIGTGTAASVAASQCRSGGWRVAVIDHLPFGGTCVLRGCDPKKVLVGAAEAIDHARRMRGKGVAGGEPRIDWRELINFKRGFTEPVPLMKENGFVKSGIDAYHGRARFVGPRTVEVGGTLTLDLSTGATQSEGRHEPAHVLQLLWAEWLERVTELLEMFRHVCANQD